MREAEINPVIVKADGVVAVDALVVLKAGRMIGFIGLGVMGEPMCRNLAAKSGEEMLALTATWRRSSA